MILMYHHISPRTAFPDNPDPSEGWQFAHSPEGFERHLRELDRRGWRFLSLPDMVRIIRETGQEPSKAVAITFDDGWRDNYDHALPLLLKLGRTATFFLTTDHFHRGVEEAKKMSAAQVRDLVGAGMTVGGHTRTHPDLTRIPEGQAQEEIEGCKADLEGLLGRPVTCFAYTGGAFNRRVAELTRCAGYQAACSVLGPADNDRSSPFWMFRDLITEGMHRPADRYRLSPLARRLLAWRVRRKLRRKLT